VTGAVRTVLIGWELGAGRGHVERLVPIIAQYLDQGWRVAAALRDVALAQRCFSGLRAKFGEALLDIIEAPRFLHRAFPAVPLVSLAQIHCYMGFGDPATVAALVRAWERLLGRYRPDLVLADASPSLNLAARERVPLTVIGNGWSVPPGNVVTPLLRAVPEGIVLPDFEARLVAAATTAVGSARAPDRFCDILRGDENRVFTLPLLDPYRAVRNEQVLWPPELPSPPPSQAERSGGLVYLPQGHPAQRLVRDACAVGPVSFRAWLGGADAGQCGHLRVEAEPIDFVREVPRSRLVIHHGGLGTAIWCLANRVPQLICAMDLEKHLIGKAVVQERLGAMFNADTAMGELCGLIKRLCDRPMT
jgi:UDP:flavonoid glycosyltransferase YjiC (YdhE family)